MKRFCSLVPLRIVAGESTLSLAIDLCDFFNNSSIFAASTVCCFERSSAHKASVAFLKFEESFIKPYFINSHSKSALAIIFLPPKIFNDKWQVVL